ncbi:MAG: hypothetical protein DMG61_02390 [Acidobacteria bacterium]|nr:MAG: hypothetical protein DMG61_02390 [Acidobacteriota bacterium]
MQSTYQKLCSRREKADCVGALADKIMLSEQTYSHECYHAAADHSFRWISDISQSALSGPTSELRKDCGLFTTMSACILNRSSVRAGYL